jgi:hypothetical protein
LATRTYVSPGEKAEVHKFVINKLKHKRFLFHNERFAQTSLMITIFNWKRLRRLHRIPASYLRTYISRAAAAEVFWQRRRLSIRDERAISPGGNLEAGSGGMGRTLRRTA